MWLDCGVIELALSVNNESYKALKAQTLFVVTISYPAQIKISN